jgi:hypothetical protein
MGRGRPPALPDPPGPIERRVFVEFGVSDYRESNTRFLLGELGWTGFVMDGSTQNVEAIRRDDVSWRYGLRSRAAFITRENINQLIRDAGISGDIGILSIDIDGNDYWVWEAIDVVSPRIVVAEYNALFGPSAAVTIPYAPGFSRETAHSSWVYFGASLAALDHLARRKGYVLVGSNRAGNNAFFVRQDVCHLAPLTPAQAYRPPCFREARDANGQLTFAEPAAALASIADQELVDVVLDRRGPVRTLVGP